MNETLDAEPVKAQRTAELFIVLKRFGQDYWTSSISYSSLEAAQTAVAYLDDSLGVTAWRIVRVSDLPIIVADGEV